MNIGYYNGNLNVGRVCEWQSVENLDDLLDRVVFDERSLIQLSISSPLQVYTHPIQRIYNVKFKGVQISRSSVNFILLDDEPDIDCPSFVISHKVDKSVSDKLKLYNTCLMPKIRGLLSVCLLLFAPYVELR